MGWHTGRAVQCGQGLVSVRRRTWTLHPGSELMWRRGSTEPTTSSGCSGAHQAWPLGWGSQGHTLAGEGFLLSVFLPLINFVRKPHGFEVNFYLCQRVTVSWVD